MSNPRNPEHDEAALLRHLWVLGPNHEPMHPKSVDEWGAAQMGMGRMVDFDDLGVCEVSTVFLGINHNYTGRGAPVLFETAIFRQDGVEIVARYRTWAEAEQGHAAVLKRLQE